MRPWVAVVVLVLWGSIGTGAAEESLGPVDWDQRDLDNGAEINMVCAGCHGEYGQGGGGGVYPRLAGLPASYIAGQLRLFKSHERENIPMIPYANDRELPEEDILDISAYLSRIRLKTRFPPEDQKMDALERLKLSKQVMVIPRAEGDVVAGEALYLDNCKRCHGRDGMGRASRDAPRLVGQYTTYLAASIAHIKDGRRKHKDMEELFVENSPEALRDILAYISTLVEPEHGAGTEQ